MSNFNPEVETVVVGNSCKTHPKPFKDAEDEIKNSDKWVKSVAAAKLICRSCTNLDDCRKDNEDFVNSAHFITGVWFGETVEEIKKGRDRKI